MNSSAVLRITARVRSDLVILDVGFGAAVSFEVNSLITDIVSVIYDILSISGPRAVFPALDRPIT